MACIKNIGCFPSCEAILFPYEALETGVHTIMFDWLGVRKAIMVEATAGEKITIPNFFNESSDPVFSILQPSGDYLCWDVENEMLADCPDDCGEDCDFYKKFTAEIIDTGGASSQGLPEIGLSDQLFNINSSQVIDNGNGTYTISVIGAVAGAMAWDENFNVYEYDGNVWTLKAMGPVVVSIVAGDNISVDSSDPANPIVGTIINEQHITLYYRISELIGHPDGGVVISGVTPQNGQTLIDEDGVLYQFDGTSFKTIALLDTILYGSVATIGGEDAYVFNTYDNSTSFTIIRRAFDSLIGGSNLSIDFTDPRNPILNVVGVASSAQGALADTAVQPGDNVVQDIATLRTTEPQANDDEILLLGYYSAIEGEGGGHFYWDETSTETDNGGTIIKVSTVTTGRWKRFDKPHVDVKDFGAIGDG